MLWSALDIQSSTRGWRPRRHTNFRAVSFMMLALQYFGKSIQVSEGIFTMLLVVELGFYLIA